MKKRELRGLVTFWNDMFIMVGDQYKAAIHQVQELKKIIAGHEVREVTHVKNLRDAAQTMERMDRQQEKTDDELVDLRVQLKETTEIADERADRIAELEKVIAGYREAWAEEYGSLKPSHDPGFDVVKQPTAFCKSIVGLECLRGETQCAEGGV